MSTEQILAALVAERDRLNQAIQILGGATTVKRRGRPPGKKAAEKGPAPVEGAVTPAEPAKPARRKKRKLSPEARARIAAAQKKRWAEFRKQ